MSNEKKLLIARVNNNIGDLFYYFVITIIIFNLNSSPTMMGLLTISYLLPGAVFPAIMKIWFNKVGEKKILLISDFIRCLCIGIMVITSDVHVLLFLVFIEQTFSVSSITAFNQFSANEVTGNKIQKFNGFISIWTNIARVVMVPIYLLVEPLTSNRFFIIINLVLTIVSLIIVICIKESDEVVKIQEQDKIHCPDTMEDGKAGRYIYYFAILIFCILCLERVAMDSYVINYSNEVWGGELKVFASFTFCTTLALILSSYISIKKKIDLYKNMGRIKYFFIICFAPIIISMFTKSSILFILSGAMVYFILNYYEISMISGIQRNIPQNTAKLMLYQTVVYNISSLVTVGIGGFLSENYGVSVYFRVLPIIVLILGIIVIVVMDRKGKRIDD